jgi:nucleotidyltransferase substrate binding protein (TIGR01987 family)
MVEDVRWQQRFANFKNAFKRLEDAVGLFKTRELSLLEEQGLIQSFEYTQELAWNVMKDYARFQGKTGIAGSRDAIREAFKSELIIDGEAWMDTIKSRNETTHAYDEKLARNAVKKIVGVYYPIFKDFRAKMESLEQ